MPGSDDSDSDEDHQGRTMATESELAPLEGAALSPDSFESMLPELCSPPSQCANVAALIWKSDAALGFSTISKLVSSRTSIPDAFESMFQVSMGRPAPSSAETGKLVRRRRPKLRRFEVHRATLACFATIARGVGSIRHVRFPKRGGLLAPECG